MSPSISGGMIKVRKRKSWAMACHGTDLEDSRPSLGFEPQIRKILARTVAILPQLRLNNRSPATARIPRNRHTMFFTATWPREAKPKRKVDVGTKVVQYGKLIERSHERVSTVLILMSNRIFG